MVRLIRLLSVTIGFVAVIIFCLLAYTTYSSGSLVTAAASISQDIMQFEFGLSGLIFFVLGTITTVKRANLMSKAAPKSLDILWIMAFFLLTISLTDALSAFTFVATNSMLIYYFAVGLLFFECAGMILIILYLQLRMVTS